MATGNATVQVQRTVHPDRSTDRAGERTILAQSLLAIGAARRTIHLENQRIDVPEVLDALRAAELNVAIWDPPTARALRCTLMAEHLGEDVSDLDDLAALRRFAEVALANRGRRDTGTDDWQGIAFSLGRCIRTA